MSVLANFVFLIVTFKILLLSYGGVTVGGSELKKNSTSLQWFQQYLNFNKDHAGIIFSLRDHGNLTSEENAVLHRIIVENFSKVVLVLNDDSETGIRVFYSELDFLRDLRHNVEISVVVFASVNLQKLNRTRSLSHDKLDIPKYYNLEFESNSTTRYTKINYLQDLELHYKLEFSFNMTNCSSLLTQSVPKHQDAVGENLRKLGAKSIVFYFEEAEEGIKLGADKMFEKRVLLIEQCQKLVLNWELGKTKVSFMLLHYDTSPQFYDSKWEMVNFIQYWQLLSNWASEANTIVVLNSAVDSSRYLRGQSFVEMGWWRGAEGTIGNTTLYINKIDDALRQFPELKSAPKPHPQMNSTTSRRKEEEVTESLRNNQTDDGLVRFEGLTSTPKPHSQINSTADRLEEQQGVRNASLGVNKTEDVPLRFSRLTSTTKPHLPLNDTANNRSKESTTEDDIRKNSTDDTLTQFTEQTSTPKPHLEMNETVSIRENETVSDSMEINKTNHQLPVSTSTLRPHLQINSTTNRPEEGTTEKESSEANETDNALLQFPASTPYPPMDLTANVNVYLMLIIILPLIAIIALVLAAVYFIRKRIQRPILSKEEIDEFIYGVDASSESALVHMAYKDSYRRTRYEISADIVSFEEDAPLLGNGEFGKVCLGQIVMQNDEEPMPVAIKMLNPKNINKSGVTGLLSEIKVLSYLGNHDHVIQLVGANTEDIKFGRVMVFLELCESGTLEGHLRKLKLSLEGDGGSVCTIEEQIPDMDDDRIDRYLQLMSMNKTPLDPSILEDLLRWSHEICMGMAYLASKNVVHAGLSTKNVLLNGEKEVKICDFGLSRRMDNYTSNMKKLQEPSHWQWMAPESLKFTQFSEKSDVWSYGVTIWEVFSLGKKPYRGLAWTGGFADLLELGHRPGEPDYNELNMYSVMRECWTTEAQNRPSFEELLTTFEGQFVNP